MTDIAEYMRQGGPCVEHGQKCRVMDAASGCACASAADEIEWLRATLREIVLITDRKHDAWDRAKLLLGGQL